MPLPKAGKGILGTFTRAAGLWILLGMCFNRIGPYSHGESEGPFLRNMFGVA